MGSDSVVAAHNRRRERGQKIAGLSNDLEPQPTLGLSLTGSGSSLVAAALSGGMRRTLENGCGAVEGGKKKKKGEEAQTPPSVCTGEFGGKDNEKPEEPPVLR